MDAAHRGGWPCFESAIAMSRIDDCSGANPGGNLGTAQANPCCWLTPIGPQLASCQAPTPHGASINGWPLSAASAPIGRSIGWTLEGSQHTHMHTCTHACMHTCTHGMPCERERNSSKLIEIIDSPWIGSSNSGSATSPCAWSARCSTGHCCLHDLVEKVRWK